MKSFQCSQNASFCLSHQVVMPDLSTGFPKVEMTEVDQTQPSWSGIKLIDGVSGNSDDSFVPRELVISVASASLPKTVPMKVKNPVAMKMPASPTPKPPRSRPTLPPPLPKRTHPSSLLLRQQSTCPAIPFPSGSVR